MTNRKKTSAKKNQITPINLIINEGRHDKYDKDSEKIRIHCSSAIDLNYLGIDEAIQYLTACKDYITNLGRGYEDLTLDIYLESYDCIGVQLSFSREETDEEFERRQAHIKKAKAAEKKKKEAKELKTYLRLKKKFDK
jgi:hypothetical protein